MDPLSENNATIALFYHSQDNDGYMSALSTLYYIEKVAKINHKTIELRPYNYEELNWDEELKQYRLALFVDCTPAPFDSFSKIAKELPCDIIVIDHHESIYKRMYEAGFRTYDNEINHLPDMKNIILKPKGYNVDFYYFYDKSTSACYNVWKALFKTNFPPKFISLVSTYDTHDVESVGQEIYDNTIVPFTYGILGRYPDPREEEVVEEYFAYFDEIMSSDDPEDNFPYDDILAEGRVILKWYTSEMAKLYETLGGMVEFEGHDFMLMFTNLKSSITFNAIPKPEGHTNTMIIYYDLVENTYKGSMYTEDKSLHLGDLAVKYGGGGHWGAAGIVFKNFEIKEEKGKKKLIIKK